MIENLGDPQKGWFESQSGDHPPFSSIAIAIGIAGGYYHQLLVLQYLQYGTIGIATTPFTNLMLVPATHRHRQNEKIQFYFCK